jgi:putative molybdopterin biosynthesis protein
MARKRYLQKTTLHQARELFLGRFDPSHLKVETVAVERALNRVTAAAVFAKISSPHYHGAAMDGICVRAPDTFGATEFQPIKLHLFTGEQANDGCFAYVDTGNAIPAWADAVIMIEKIRRLDDNTVEIFESAVPWQHVRLVGEDVVATELLLTRWHRLRPYDLGALLAAGHREVAVLARPRIGIIPTGDELLSPGDDYEPGRIVEFNSTVLSALIKEAGGDPQILPQVGDNPEKLRTALETALRDHNMVCIIAGSSAGEHDFTAEVIAATGELLVHGIDVMPGKPAILGMVRRKPVVGVPGYPVSAIVVGREIVEPALANFLGQGYVARPTVKAVLPKRMASHLGVEELVRVTLGRVETKLVAVPLRRGAGVITTMVQADGLMRIPSLSEGVNAGEEVEIELLRPAEEIEGAILCAGSHDLSIDILGNELKRLHPVLKIAASNVGSMGALLSVQRRETHIGGTHLLDPASGSYNIPDIKSIIPSTPVVLIHLVRRQQGLLVQPGNPKGINALSDLTSPEVTFVNRQSGSGTRVLLDYELAKRSLDPSKIRGYKREEFTHMAVAVAVASGLADVGLAVKSAAQALKLDFIAVGDEQYDLLFLRSFFESESGANLVTVIRSAGFRQAVEALGGYDASRSGEILYQH